MAGDRRVNAACREVVQKVRYYNRSDLRKAKRADDCGLGVDIIRAGTGKMRLTPVLLERVFIFLIKKITGKNGLRL